IFRTMVTGLDGTPMPSYAFLAGMGDQGWSLVHYIQSLIPEGGEFAFPQGTPSIKALKGLLDPNTISTQPNDFVWKQIPSTAVPLRPLWARENWVDTVKIQVLASVISKTLTFRLEWKDSTKDEEVLSTNKFRDGVAIQYSIEGSPKDYLGIPFIGMGDWNGSVRIWHWKADWQVDIDKGFQDPTSKYGSTMDWVPEESSKQLALSGLSAGNSMSVRKRKSSVEALIAKGFGTLTSLPEEDQNAQGRAIWENGKWVVLIQIKNFSGLERLTKHQSIPIAIAVWDGSAGDRNGQKSVSQWMSVSME
ncbi:MAG: ethylbenzene dehydrogenase-related protein, partial [Planctomycetota bacterium]